MEDKNIPKIFITKYGVFYEGQTVLQYSMHGIFLHYVKINKFVVHYFNRESKNNYRKNRKPELFVNFQDLRYKTKNFTVSAEQLGRLYKIHENF